MAYTCNSSYSGGRDEEDQVYPSKKLARPPSQKIGRTWWHTDLITIGGISRRILLQDW
jgi:hypothetical protein